MQCFAVAPGIALGMATALEDGSHSNALCHEQGSSLNLVDSQLHHGIMVTVPARREAAR